MGCDIHFYIEKMNQYRVWENVDVWVPKWWGNESEIDEKWFKELSNQSFCSERNYTLFGVLAGVRDTEVEPLDYPRGLPDDVSSIVKAELYDEIHSKSWFLLKELYNYDWHIYSSGECEYDSLHNFRENVIPKLEQIGDPDKVRIVFGFDS